MYINQVTDVTSQRADNPIVLHVLKGISVWDEAAFCVSMTLKVSARTPGVLYSSLVQAAVGPPVHSFR